MTEVAQNNIGDVTSREIGRVKWFNMKSGYGFITVDDKDIFVHHSSIGTSGEQYKYLLQGEYVSLNVVKSTSSDHELQAADVRGANGGQLMCETRHQNRMNRKTEDAGFSAVKTRREQRTSRPAPAPSTAPRVETGTGARGPRQKRVWRPRDQSTGK
jgi:CspA family cold shock protein